MRKGKSKEKREVINGIELTPGGVIRSPGSTSATKTGNWRSERPVIDSSKCTRCGLCWTFCPDAAIRKNSNGYFEIDYDYCKGCGICASVCPVKAITMQKEEK